MDHVPPEIRSRIMARVRGSDTKPELLVRRLAHRLGYRYRLHVADLPGRPDLVFRSRRKVIFVHGCFWHQHDCRRGTRPKDNQEFWSTKLNRNRARDAAVTRSLITSGWQVLVVWECQTHDETKLAKRLDQFLR
jgi:DNA mismatch endonuclease (patch repair protein)